MSLGGIVVEQPVPSETSQEKQTLSDNNNVPEEARDTLAVKVSSFTSSANNIQESRISKEVEHMSVSVTRSEVTRWE